MSYKVTNPTNKVVPLQRPFSGSLQPGEVRTFTQVTPADLEKAKWVENVGALGITIEHVDNPNKPNYASVAPLQNENLAAPIVTVAAEAGGTTIDVTIQAPLVDARVAYDWWISDDEAGALAAVAPSGGISVQTGVEFGEFTANKSGKVITDATGQAVLRLVEAGALVIWLNVITPAGQITSVEITFAA